MKTVQLAAAGTLLMTSGFCFAVPQMVQSLETPHCDVLPPLTLVDELGLPTVFPMDEAIDAVATFINQSACPEDDPGVINAIVQITNLTSRTFLELYYVADPAIGGLPGTTISNEDGLVNGGQAFRIDMVGLNRPLVFESMVVDGLFAPGETWRFIIDDYMNGFGISARDFLSIGVGFASPGPPSSGSIIAIPVPEPASAGAIGLLAMGMLRRQRMK